MKKIKLNGKHGIGKYAIVDDEDFERVSNYKWNALSRKNTSYPVCSIQRNGKSVTQYMHRFVVANIPEGMMIDHINRDGLDNRKSNLRIATKSDNMKNRSLPTNTGESMISSRKDGYLVNYNTGNSRAIRYFRNINDARVFRDEIKNKYYKFESNLPLFLNLTEEGNV